MSFESDTKAKILAAARQVFVAKGRDGARMQEIADLAGVNKALLHYYFTSKDNLYLEVVIGVFGQLFGKLEELFSTAGTFEEQIKFFVNQHVDYIAQNRDVLKLVVSELLRDDSTIIRGLADLISVKYNFPRRIFDLFQKAIENNEIRPHELLQTMLSILSMNITYFIIAPLVKMIIPGNNHDEEKFISERKQAIIDLVFRGIQNQSN
jgi:AcrR family transcriptional regulator